MAVIYMTRAEVRGGHQGQMPPSGTCLWCEKPIQATWVQAYCTLPGSTERLWTTRVNLPCGCLGRLAAGRFLWGDRFLRATPALIAELLLQCD